MDVSKKSDRIGNQIEEGPQEVKTQIAQPEGPALMGTLATLTGLPESVVNDEVKHILQTAEQDASAPLTLDALRTAMLAYLETISAEMEAEGLIEAPSEATSEEYLEELRATNVLPFSTH